LDTARRFRIYVDPGAILEHPMSLSKEPPTEVEMWQAQMLLWISTGTWRARSRE